MELYYTFCINIVVFTTFWRNFMELYNDFQRLSIFSDTSENDILAMAHCFNIRIKNFAKNSVIVEAGAPLTSIILIIKGGAMVESYDANGDLSIIMKLKSGDVYAIEGAFAGESSYSYDLVATEKTSVAILNKHRLCKICDNRCKRHILLLEKIMNMMAERNFSLLEKISYMSKKTIREKVLNYLYNQSSQNNSSYFDIPFNKTELANFLSVDRSALSSELNKLKKEKVIDFEKKRYHILKDKLKNI